MQTSWSGCSHVLYRHHKISSLNASAFKNLSIPSIITHSLHLPQGGSFEHTHVGESVILLQVEYAQFVPDSIEPFESLSIARVVVELRSSAFLYRPALLQRQPQFQNSLRQVQHVLSAALCRQRKCCRV